VNVLAKAAIRRLRAGVVPSWALDRISVGYEEVRHLIESAVVAILQGQQAHPIFVLGEWGTGKTHLLSFVLNSATALGVPTARVNLNAAGAPLNYPQRFYPSFAESLQHESNLGLQRVLSHLLTNRDGRDRAEAFSRTPAAADIGWCLRQLCGQVDGLLSPVDEANPAWYILCGGDICWADYAYKRDIAIARLKALAALFHELGLGGIVLVFDEAETIDQLWNIKSRLSAYSVLGKLLSAPHLWCVLGVTERFGRTVQMDLDRGCLEHSSVTDVATTFLRTWKQNCYPMMAPPSIGAKQARRLGDRIYDLYVEAYGPASVGRDCLDGIVDSWRNNPAQNPRRLIRLIVEKLDILRPMAAANT
jgi:hypothetical protein